ncbi:hypothetical protein K435DRAFT_649528, partial [Dendrothele bispora CBS 962.96]
TYNSIIDHIQLLAAENLERLQTVVKEYTCSIVWDNINIAFRVESQRLDSKSHFDNGTTGSLLLVVDPDTGENAPLGSLPLEWKPPRTHTKSIIENHDSLLLISPADALLLDSCLLWQLKSIALEHIPSLSHLKRDFGPCISVDQITPRKTEQYPLPAMHIDESSLDGTIEVEDTILHTLGISNDDIRKHGLLFVDGDLLTDSLNSKTESARRNSSEPIQGRKCNIRRYGLFHQKMAGARMVINEHWGKPNGRPGSLWWEHTQLLGRKPMVAGWQSKKAAPWKQSHELIQISLAAHVLDGFRLFCGHDDLHTWASHSTMHDFDLVAQKVYENLFTSSAYEKILGWVPDRPQDKVFFNSILYNRDALLYWLFVTSIKAGDIGRVLLVLRIWMVMMRTPKTMPKYADAIFETLGRLQSFNPVLQKFFLHNWLVNLTGKPFRFKEIDLLQEHQNFWLKVIYSAKGVNKSWKWLAMIAVCIYSLRDAMKTVQSAFKISSLGVQHTVPDMTAEITLLAENLRNERIQEFVDNRAGNDSVNAVRDLLAEGSKYANSRNAFSKFKESKDIIENEGFQEGLAVGTEIDEKDVEEEEEFQEYEPTSEDLALDDEEPLYDFIDTSSPHENE